MDIRLKDRKIDDVDNYTKELSIKYFGKKYNSYVSYNDRLKRVAGRCFTKDGRIELSTAYALHSDIDELKGTILHELVHYHLDRAGYVNEKHGRRFLSLAYKVNANLKATIDIKYFNHVECKCVDCGNKFCQYNAFDVNNYKCARCGGKLTLKHVKAIK